MSAVLKFQSTRPLRGGPFHGFFNGGVVYISIHPPLAGRARLRPHRRLVCAISIHPPLAGRARNKTLILLLFCISIHPPLAGRAVRGGSQLQQQAISIHPPLAGRASFTQQKSTAYEISIHPPLAGRASDLAQKSCAKHRILHKKCIYPGRIERFSGFDAAIFLPNVHKFRCEPSEESLLAPRSHAYTIRTPSG